MWTEKRTEGHRERMRKYYGKDEKRKQSKCCGPQLAEKFELQINVSRDSENSVKSLEITFISDSTRNDDKRAEQVYILRQRQKQQ